MTFRESRSSLPSYQFGPSVLPTLTVVQVRISWSAVREFLEGVTMQKLRYSVRCCVAWLGLCFCVAFAQDPTKVEPKHYKLAFENEYVQVVNVHYGPHEKSELHAHPGGVVVVLTAGHLRFTDQNGKTQEVFAKPGDPRWFPPFRHKVENLGETSYNAVYIGIKNKHLANEVSRKAGPSEMDEQMKKVVANAILAAMK
jgi:beta-alanine degradation protein BauB